MRNGQLTIQGRWKPALNILCSVASNREFVIENYSGFYEKSSGWFVLREIKPDVWVISRYIP